MENILQWFLGFVLSFEILITIAKLSKEHFHTAVSSKLYIGEINNHRRHSFFFFLLNLALSNGTSVSILAESLQFMYLVLREP